MYGAAVTFAAPLSSNDHARFSVLLRQRKNPSEPRPESGKINDGNWISP
jgi:uncharacterized membrane protein